MTIDHARMSALLDRVDAGPAIDTDSFERLRHALLHHISLEQRVLLPAARRHAPLRHAAQLQTDHAAVVKLLHSTPTTAVCRALRDTLCRLHALEEGPNGLYAVCDQVLAGERQAVLAELGAYPAAPRRAS